jgi:acetyl-CoA/propionyl-CoA carboxylase biotin carboxyl carrier protein
VRRVFVANRGEIAVRVIRACRDAGIESVAGYADPDRGALFTRLADEAVALPGATAAETYLDIDAVVGAAVKSDADAVHPGYGFLSESEAFARAVLDAGLIWIGPGPDAIALLGDKVSARRLAAAAGVPMVAGTPRPLTGADEVAAFAAEHGLPLAIKAAYGGGGRGLRVVTTMEEIPVQWEAAVRESTAAFGRGECFVERYLARARHVEAQVVADRHGHVVVVGTRDCTLQRRHQKLVEEAPAPWLSAEQHASIVASAEAVCRAAGYESAGTVEYLVGEDGSVSFLEVNTRLQVEHPVTEETTGVDLVAEQFRIADGLPLSFLETPEPRGHSIEFRINGEDPGAGFLPAPGTVTALTWPAGPGIRVDTGIELGCVVGTAFDSLLGKLIVTGADRAQALDRARRALDETVVDGLPTVLPFHRAVVRDPAFIGSSDGFGVHTRWIEEEFATPMAPYAGPPAAATGAATGEATVEIGGRLLAVHLPGLAALPAPVRDAVTASMRDRQRRAGAAAAGDGVRPPMQGTVVGVAVKDGDHVEVGATLVVIEAMKMENAVVAHRAGTVTGLTVEPGASVGPSTVLCRIIDPPAGA